MKLNIKPGEKPLPPGENPIAVNKYYYYYYFFFKHVPRKFITMFHITSIYSVVCKNKLTIILLFRGIKMYLTVCSLAAVTKKPKG